MDKGWINRIKRIEYRAATILMVMVPVVQKVLENTSITLGVAVGGIFELLCFHILRRFLEKILDGTRRDKAKIVTIAIVVKFLVVGAGIFFFTSAFSVGLFSQLFGVSLMGVSIFIERFLPEKDNRH